MWDGDPALVTLHQSSHNSMHDAQAQPPVRDSPPPTAAATPAAPSGSARARDVAARGRESPLPRPETAESPTRAEAWALRAWHRLLTPSGIRPPAAARLRGWARVLEWRAATTTGRMRLVKRAVWTPVRAWKEAAAAVATFGHEVAETAGVSRGAQRRQLWWLGVRHGLSAESYIDYALYQDERRRRAGAYLEQREHAMLVWWLLRRQPVEGGFPGRDKTAFPAWCRAHRLAGVPTLLEFEEGRVVASTLGGDGAAALPRYDLFAKPSDSQYGTDSTRWEYDGNGRWLGADGRWRTADELVAEFARLSRGLRRSVATRPNRLLVQPRLRNHAILRPLAPRALCTLRMLTCRAPGEAGQIVFAAFRMAVGDAPADNFHFGGIIAPVELDSGVLGPALRRREHVLLPIERHPDTNAPIAGHPLPCWDRAKALVLRAFAAAPERATVGWDVAISDDGPILVEGNTASHPDIAQATMRAPLSDTPYPAALEAHVRAALGV